MNSQGRESAPAAQEELAALGRISGELLHDLANDITVLQGWALLARGEQEAGRHAAAEIERVLELTSEMGTMLRDLLETLAGQRVARETGFDPVRLTEETLAHWVRELAGVSVRMHLGLEGEARVAGRGSFWSRSLRNVLGNAARHAHSSIVITLTSEVSEDGHWLVLRVENDGQRIEPDRRAELFEPLRRGAGGGYGLGLSSAAWSIGQLRGRISCVDPVTLVGAAFEIRVPLVTPRITAAVPRNEGGAAAGAGAGDGTTAPEAGSLQGTRLVLLEHDPLERRAQMRLLRRLGAEVLVLTTEFDPDDVIVSRMEGALPHLVLVDLDDPERDGMGVWNLMCIESPHLAERVVFTLLRGSEERGHQLAALTGQPCLLKPFSPDSLVELANRFRLPG